MTNEESLTGEVVVHLLCSFLESLDSIVVGGLVSQTTDSLVKDGDSGTGTLGIVILPGLDLSLFKSVVTTERSSVSGATSNILSDSI